MNLTSVTLITALLPPEAVGHTPHLAIDTQGRLWGATVGQWQWYLQEPFIGGPFEWRMESSVLAVRFSVVLVALGHVENLLDNL